MAVINALSWRLINSGIIKYKLNCINWITKIISSLSRLTNYEIDLIGERDGNSFVKILIELLNTNVNWLSGFIKLWKLM